MWGRGRHRSPWAVETATQFLIIFVETHGTRGLKVLCTFSLFYILEFIYRCNERS